MSESTPNETGSLRGCAACGKFTRQNVARCPYCDAPLPALNRPNAISGLFGAYGVTYTVIGVCIFVYILELLVSVQLAGSIKKAFSMSGLLSLGGIHRYAGVLLGSNHFRLVYEGNQYWRLLTACFLHGSLLHIFMNCWCLKTLGEMLEGLWGKMRFWSIYIGAGISGSLLSLGYNVIFHNGEGSSLGASGAVLGLLGLAYGFTRRHPERVNAAGRSMIIRWLLLIVFMGLLVPNIDNAGHAGGFIFGFLVGFFVSPPDVQHPSVNSQRVWAGLAIMCGIIVLVSFGFAGWFYLGNVEAIIKGMP